MTTPTLKEVLSGEGLLPYTLPQFASYLESCHCLENLEFVLGIDNLVNSTGNIQQIWNRIYNDFLLETSQKEVNLPYSLKSELIQFKPESGQVPTLDIISETTKKVYELLENSYNDFRKHVRNNNIGDNSNRRISEAISPCINVKYVELPKSPESFSSQLQQSQNQFHIQNEVEMASSPTLFNPTPRPSFSHFQLDNNSNNNKLTHTSRLVHDDGLYTLPRALPSPKPYRRASEPVQETDENQNESLTFTEVTAVSTGVSKSSRQNSASSSSRGSSFGSIVETIKSGEHINWRRAVKKFKIRRFLNEHLDEE